jgi:diguanylate cyclase (GGDEF)-like protein
MPARRRAADATAAQLQDRFTTALVEGDTAAAHAVAAAALHAGLDVAAIHARVIGPALVRIGELWASGTATVGDEHVATAISQEVVARLFPVALRAPPASREGVVLAGVEDERHLLGLQMVADVLEGEGFDVRLVDDEASLERVVGACAAVHPAVVGLSVTLPENVPALRRAVGRLATLPDRPAVVVGGAAVTAEEISALGAVHVPTAEEAVQAVTVAAAGGRRAPVHRHGGTLGRPVAGRTAGRWHGSATIEADEHAFSAVMTSAADAIREAARRAYAMEQLALRDELTGLWNRRACEDRLHELEDAEEPRGMLLLVDADELKAVNDTQGHAAGDEVLRSIARALTGAVRGTDFVARYAGDEFVLVLPGAGRGEAQAVAARIRGLLAGGAAARRTTVSIGGAPVLADRRRTLLLADGALYDAKRAGRDRTVLAAGGPR